MSFLRTILHHFADLPHSAQSATVIAAAAVVALLLCIALRAFARSGGEKFGRRDLGWLVLAGFLLMGAGAGTRIVVASLNGIRFTDQFASSSSTGGIAEAYADLPATGGKVVLGSNITISASQTLSFTLGKPLVLDMSGRTITCTNTSGVCLKIFKADGAPRDNLKIANGVIAYSGASTGITGLQIGDATHPATNISVSSLSINNFNTAGSVGMDLNFVEDSHFDSISFNGNTLALQLDIATNQNQFSNVWFQQNVNVLQATDAAEYTFEDCLIQSNTGTKPVQIIASTINVVGVRFKHCHFENNGDTTANARQISFNIATGKVVVRVAFEDNVFNGGTNGGSSTVFEAIGLGSVQFASFNRNNYGITNKFTGAGFVDGQGLTVEAENMPNFDVGLNPGNITGCDNNGTGLVFAPVGAGKNFQIYGGWPANFNSTLLFKDCTVPEYILKYNSSTWDFQNKLIKTSSGYQGVESTGAGGFASSDTLWGDSTAHRWKMNNNNAGADTVGDVLMQDCGTTTTCAATNLRNPQIVKGNVVLTAGSATITGISPAFTSSTSFECSSYDATTLANPSKAAGASASSITVTGTGTDVIHYVCAGN